MVGYKPPRRKKKKPAKSKLQKRKDNPRSTYWEKKADTVWAEIMHEHLFVGCAVCGRTDVKLEAHHLLTRAKKSTRHRLENGIILCSSHHQFSRELSAHKAPLEFFLWMEEHRPDQLQWVKDNRHKIRTLNYKLTLERLVAVRGRLRYGHNLTWGPNGIDV